jgi:hypothetical protein
MSRMLNSFRNFSLRLLWDLQRLYVRIKPYRKVRKVSLSARTLTADIHLVRRYRGDLRFLNYKQDLSLDRKVFVIVNVTANTRTGVVWKSGRILKESSVWSITDLLQWEPKPIYAKRVDGNCVLLPDNGYFHFLIEELPRFLDAISEDNSSTVVYGSNSPYIRDFIDLADLNSRARYIPFPVKFSSLKLCEKSLGGIASSRDIESLRAYFKNSAVDQLDDRQHLFISRRQSAKESERGLEYYQDVEKLVSGMGFSIVYLEDYTLQEQINMISVCKTLIGFHGAGLANLIWMDAGSRVIEVVHNRETSHFEYLSEIAGHVYQKVNMTQLLAEPSLIL